MKKYERALEHIKCGTGLESDFITLNELVERATQLDNVITKDIMKMTPTELSVFKAYNIIKRALGWDGNDDNRN